MKIRTRLLLFLLPTLIGGIALIAALLAYHLSKLMQAGLSADLIDQKIHTCLLISSSAGFTIVLMVVMLYLIANRISRPVQKLNNSALAIAAGQYGESITVQGPKEIAELANTLNTMSQCLLENINRLKENSLHRERVCGEYECSMMLQHLMLQKNIDDCRSDAIAVKPITFFSPAPKGLLLDLPKNNSYPSFQIHMAEADEEGFEGMYQLLTSYKHSKEGQHNTTLTLHCTDSILKWSGAHPPLVWSVQEGQFLEWNANCVKIESGDFFFLFNQGLLSFYKGRQRISDTLAKVLKIFTQDGFETTFAMLQKEIGFAVKRKKFDEDIHLLCFQILNL